MSKEVAEKLDRVIEILMSARPVPAPAETPMTLGPDARARPLTSEAEEEAMFLRFKNRLLKDPTVLRVLSQQAKIELDEAITPVKVDGKSIRGILCKMILEGLFDDGLTPGAACQEIKRRGKDAIASNVARDMNWLAAEGFLTREGGSDGYKVNVAMKKHIER